MIRHNTFTTLKHYLPTVGIIIFFGLFIYATWLYPLGAPFSNGVHLYLCNLLDSPTKHGLLNPARPYAMMALLILLTSLWRFFFMFANFYSQSLCWKWTIKISGSLSVILVALLLTGNHLVTIIASVLGAITLVGIILGVAQSHLILYQITGIVCVFLLVLNNAIYYSGLFIDFLPLIQKITFVIVLFWVMGLNHKMVKKNNFYKNS